MEERNVMRSAFDLGGRMYDKSPDPFYRSARWLRMRRAALNRDRWICTECARYGKRVGAVAVHHVFPRNEFPEMEWTGWNLASLCKGCHDAMHDRKTNALTARGVELLKRTARRAGVDVPMRYGD